MSKRTIDQWAYLVRCSVYGVTPDQANAIGKMCFDAEARGDNCAVWHQSAAYFGHRCNCAQCNPTAPKGRFAAKFF